MFQATFIMSGRVFILSIWMCLFLMIPGRCEENLQLFVDRLEILEDNYDNLKSDLVSYEQRTKRRIYRAKTSVRNEIKNTMKKQIKDTVLDILRSDSVADMITSRVISETRHMKRVNQQMRRELHQLRSFLVHVQSDNMMYKKSFEESEIENNEICSKCLESNTLTSKFAEIHDNITKLDEKVINLNNLQHQQKEDSFKRSSEAFVFHGPVTASSSDVSTSPTTTTLSSSTNSTSTSQKHKYIGESLKTSSEQEPLTAPKSVVTPSPSSLTYTSTTSATSTTSTTTLTLSTTRKTSTSTTAASTTPPIPQGERNRILVFRFNGDKATKVRQIDIKSQAVTMVSNLKLKMVWDAVYVSKLNSLLIAQFVPKRILSYNMYNSSAVTLRNNLMVKSISVDEGRDFVFLASFQHPGSICRMDLKGEHLTVLFNTTAIPYVVVVNPQTRTIYVSTRVKLFTMTYNADNVHTVATGSFYSFIFAATLDVSKEYLYYSRYKSLYRYSISENSTTTIAHLGFIPFQLRYYSDTIYGSWSNKNGPVMAFDLKTNMLHKLNVRSGFDTAIICLVP